MRIVNGAKAKGITPELVLGMVISEAVFNQYGKELIITSMRDGQHMTGSKHYEGNGVDFRIKHLDGSDADLSSEDLVKAKTIVSDLKNVLGPDYDVVLESNHIHLEFDPK